jgi:hypothetical protein
LLAVLPRRIHLPPDGCFRDSDVGQYPVEPPGPLALPEPVYLVANDVFDEIAEAKIVATRGRARRRHTEIVKQRLALAEHPR